MHTHNTHIPHTLYPNLKVALATFTTYALAYKDDPDNQLTAQRAFVALSLFNILRFPLSMLPMLIPNFIQVSKSGADIKGYCVSNLSVTPVSVI